MNEFLSNHQSINEIAISTIPTVTPVFFTALSVESICLNSSLSIINPIEIVYASQCLLLMEFDLPWQADNYPEPDNQY